MPSINPLIKELVDGIIATSREAKQPFVERAGVPIAIWIDDNPRAVNESAMQIRGTSSPEGQIIEPVHE